MKIPLIMAALCVAPAASAQTPPEQQPGIGATGSMYNGNNAVRSPIAARPEPSRQPAGAAGSVTSSSTQQSDTATGGGAGGGEH